MKFGWNNFVWPSLKLIRKFQNPKLPSLFLTPAAGGFSLIEVLLVSAITSMLLMIFVVNFRTASTNTAARHQVSSAITADIRNAQSRAISGTRFRGNIVCGYGLHQVDSTSYLIYAGAPEGAASSCALANRNYRAGVDFPVETKKILNPNMSISGPLAGLFADVFFESPDPKVYLNNNYGLSPLLSTDINVANTGQACSQVNCTTIRVFSSGLVEQIN